MINSKAEGTGNKWWRTKRYTILYFKKKLNETTKYLGQDLGVSTDIRTQSVLIVTTIATSQGHVRSVVMCILYRVSQEECARLREGVPYVKVHRYNPKHLCPKLNGYGDNGQRSLKL